MLSVGEQLKQAREALRLSARDVSSATKIQPWVLDALEKNQLHTSMSPVYVKSFINTYARHVHLDPHPLIARLFPEPERITPPSTAPTRVSVKPVWSPPTISWLTLAAAWRALQAPVVVAVGLLGIVALVKTGPWKAISTKAPHQQASLAVTPEKPSAPKAVELQLPTAKPLELSVTARQAMWVSVKADGRLMAQRQLAEGSQETWKARKQLELILAKPSQADVLLNGEPINEHVVAHRGRVAITHSRIKPLAP